MPIPSCRALARTAGSNPPGGTGGGGEGEGAGYVLRVLCTVRQISLRPADHSIRGVLPNVVRLSVIVKLPL
jgi:hypothetical protein